MLVMLLSQNFAQNQHEGNNCNNRRHVKLVCTLDNTSSQAQRTFRADNFQGTTRQLPAVTHLLQWREGHALQAPALQCVHACQELSHHHAKEAHHCQPVMGVVVVVGEGKGGGRDGKVRRGRERQESGSRGTNVLDVWRNQHVAVVTEANAGRSLACQA